MAEPRSRVNDHAVLKARNLHVHYGHSHALQGIDISLDTGTHAVLGRNGMGKSTLCKAITGLLPITQGSVTLSGTDITGLPPNQIANLGVGYTPQGRLLWPSLTVDEHLRLCASGAVKGGWDVGRVYDTFPKLRERKGLSGTSLSGGEQQMLAIARALLRNPRLLVLDEPTEGLSPLVVSQVIDLLKTIVKEGDVAVLLVEQNIAVATAVAEDVTIIVNGKVIALMPASRIAADRKLQGRLLGIGRHSDIDLTSVDTQGAIATTVEDPPGPEADDGVRDVAEPEPAPTKWGSASWTLPSGPPGLEAKAENHVGVEAAIGKASGKVVVAGTFDTKGPELLFMRDVLRDHGLSTVTVDLSTTTGHISSADVPPHHVAACAAGGG